MFALKWWFALCAVASLDVPAVWGAQAHLQEAGASAALEDGELPQVVIEKTSPELQAKGGGEFSMRFKHFPPECEIVMTCAHVIQKNPEEFKEIERLTIDGQGRIWVKGTPIAFYTFGAEGIAKGERVKYKYALADGSVLAESSFIPYPLVVNSKKKTFSVEIELLALEPAVYLLTYCGLQNGERMRLRSKSGKEEVVDEDFFYRAGIPSAYMPGVAGQDGGYAVLDIVRLAGDSIKIKIPWGMEVLRSVWDTLPDAPSLKGPAAKKARGRRP